MAKFDIYLAGPFFTPEQIATMDAALAFLREQGYEVFNPREHGPIISAIAPHLRTPELFDEILERNRSGVSNSYVTVACIDDRDSGTMWELGYGHALGIQQITFSGKGHGANVMVSRSVHGHCPTLDALRQVMAAQCSYIKGRSSLKALNVLAATDQ